MASNEIVEKLNKLIVQPDAFMHEKDVVYFFVQIRKLMERDDVFSDYASIKFYCDWVVHPQKDRHHDSIADIYEGIYRDCVDFCNEAYDDESDNILSLMQFKNLKADLEPLFDRYNLNTLLLNKLWTRLTRSLLSVLKDQPLVNRQGENIKEIMITDADNNLFIIKITFAEPISDKHGLRHSDFTYGLEYMS